MPPYLHTSRCAHGAFAALSLLLAAPAALRAQAALASPVARDLLVITDAHLGAVADESSSQAHAVWQMPWNHLGLRMQLRYLDAGAPDDVDPAVTRAVVLDLVGENAAPAWLWPWLWRQRERQPLHFLHLGSLQSLHAADPQQLVAWLESFGFEAVPWQIDNPLRVAWEPRDRARCAFEATPVERRQLGPRSRAAANDVWLTTRDRRDPTDVRSPIAVGPRLAIALDPWVMAAGTGIGDRRWYLDPFAFSRAAFDLDDVPAPDPSVAWGRRKFVLHIDGDGFDSVSSVAAERTAAAVFHERIVERTTIPMTLSVIVRSLTDDIAIAKSTPAMELASRMFSVPWVEAASHTVLHPLDWRREPSPRPLPKSMLSYDDGSLANYRHDLRAEVIESVRFVDERLAPRDRPCRLLFWSGAANPTAEIVAACDEVSCLNLNGGLFRCDDGSPSIGNVSPWGLQQGGTFQVYCGAANENVFDGFYTTLPTAFRHVHATIERTGSPRILKPANVYAHFYSSEHEPRLEVLEELIVEWAYRRPTVPVFASEYAAAVLDAQRRCAIARTATGFRCLGFTACRTLRFDHWPHDRHVDWAQSQGVLGMHRIGDSVYLQLAPGDSDIVFASSPVLAPHLVESDHELSDVTRGPNGLRLRSRAFRTRHLVVGGLPAASAVVYRLGGAERNATTDVDGRLTIDLPAAGDDIVEVGAR